MIKAIKEVRVTARLTPEEAVKLVYAIHKIPGEIGERLREKVCVEAILKEIDDETK